MENGLTDGGRDYRHDEVKTRSYPKDDHQDSTRPAVHRRPLSNSILSRFGFLRASSEDGQAYTGGQGSVDRDPADRDYARTHESAMTWAQKNNAKPRRRTGSLRKTAILGTGRIRAEGRERRNTLTQLHPPEPLPKEAKVETSLSLRADDVVRASGASQALQRRFSYDKEADSPSTMSDPPAPAQTLSLQTEAPRPSTSSNDFSQPGLASPVKSPTSQSNASTTDDDDALSFPNNPSSLLASLHQTTTSSSSSSYFPSPEAIARRRSTTKPLSPLSALPMDAYEEEEHSYSETEWWGWVVLIVTWIVFVVGMGSCLEVWSWAWDVGQTPYAPPELEDDPTLPIVGYYPALIILTAVMAWVWVVVAWVGMKYFKHAKIQPDDS